MRTDVYEIVYRDYFGNERIDTVGGFSLSAIEEAKIWQDLHPSFTFVCIRPMTVNKDGDFQEVPAIDWKVFKQEKPPVSGVYLISYGRGSERTAEWHDWMGAFYAGESVGDTPLNPPLRWANFAD